MKNFKLSVTPCTVKGSYQIMFKFFLNPKKVGLKTFKTLIKNENFCLMKKKNTSVTFYKNSKLLIKNVKNKTVANNILKLFLKENLK